ncbi:MAG TPA: hypothetical protein VGM93_03200, partial [Acidimicrobiales bacterium]
MARRTTRLGALAAAVLLLAACSGNSDHGKQPAATVQRAPGGAAVVVTSRWTAARARPCDFVPARLVTLLTGASDWRGKAGAEGTCRYAAPGSTGELDVALLRQQSRRSLAVRTAGLQGLGTPGTFLLRPDTPGLGLVAAHGGSAVVVVLRDADRTEAVLQLAVAAVARDLRPQLPDIAYGRAGRLRGDPCGWLAPNLVEPKAVAGDSTDPRVCAYRAVDGTLLTLDIGRTRPADLVDLGEALPTEGPRARLVS